MIKKILSYGAGKTLARGFNWLLLATLPVVLPSHEYGIVGILVAMEGVGRGVILFGQDRAVLRFYGQSDDPSSFLLSLLAGWGIIAGPVLLATLLAAIAWQGDIFGVPSVPHLVILIPTVIGIGLFRIGIAVLRVSDWVRQYIFFESGLTGLKLVAVFVAVWTIGGSSAYVYGLGLSVIVVIGMLGYSLRERVRGSINTAQIKKIWRFGWPFIFHSTGGTLLLYLDRFMVEYFKGAAAVGIYSLAYSLGAAISFIYAALAMYFEPQIYQRADNVKASESWLSLYTFLCAGLSSTVSIVLVVVLPGLIGTVYAPEYRPIIQITPVIIAGHLLLVVYRQANYRLTLHEATRILASGTIVALVANFGLNYILVPKYGPWGAAVATVLGHLLLAAYLMGASIKTGNAEFRHLRGKAALAVVVVAPIFTIFVSNVVGVIGLFGVVVAVSGVFVWKRRREIMAMESLSGAPGD